MRNWIRSRRHSSKSEKARCQSLCLRSGVDTRSTILNEQHRGQLGSRDDLAKNADGSVDIYSGPTSPKSYEKNWIQTVPGKACSWVFDSTRLPKPTSIRVGHCRTSRS
jgi:hypothetical protein